MGIINFLKGKRTYIIGTLMFLTGGSRALNLIDQHTYETVMGLLGGLGFVAVRAALPSNS